MNFKKKVSGSWVDAPYYLKGTDTETITTLPATIYPLAQTATLGLKGNTVQSGTPTPDNPIMPQGTGERTGNLADLYNVNKTRLNLTFTTGNNMTVVINGTKANGTNVIPIAEPNVILPAGTYTVTIKMISGSITNTSEGAFFGINGNTYSQRTTPNVKEIGDVGKRTFTLSEDTLLSSLDIAPSYSNTGSVWNDATFECMLYSGSDDIPYEPFGVKIPISSAGQTTPVYLGEVETTRKIYKYEFKGSETWGAGSENYYSFVPQIYGDGVPFSAIICSHCSNATINNTGQAVWFKKTAFPDITTGAELKQFCADQYAAGTPVTVWYVLATEQTGIVNEPLMKIGEYADTVSNISIPVTAEGDTLSVGTTVQPSEVTVNYKGWHPVADVHERTNGAWT